MTSIIDELYYGNILPMEQIVSDNPDCFPLVKKIDVAFETLKNKLGEEDAARLELINSNCSELSALSSCAAFSHGLRLGVVLMSEVFSGGAK